jgi:hypothetical protein
MIRHQLLLRFRPEVPDDTKARLFGDMSEVAETFEGIADFQTRRNISGEADLVRGFNDIFWFDIVDMETRDRFLADAAHLEVAGRIVEYLSGGLDGVAVADFQLD